MSDDKTTDTGGATPSVGTMLGGRFKVESVIATGPYGSILLAVPCLSHRVAARAGQPTEPVIQHIIESIQAPR